ncbi:vanillate O-demethylase oxidoreductase VanB [Pseudomonas sp. FW306-02-F02-AA]|uniref:Vanillate O-demethylase oxidoreductase VanB n=1 Tax=Pseudomonas fluorescens TaxID=294 RepID=A0A0N9WMS5_PSEFL|nr:MULTISPECIES: SRPBCC family protein [Pseudomonas]ALI03171.1 vanillate O-demethylase oxidoreductase VanB [Pseudomonas fluorescens]PMZ00777.1 vanillate O-demethylase oxidoreductase VanB [Pseudomonas sp. FW306-02-F02-AB]PMZ06630.1 vanillate O-demethylase oxidoreductase VanB [Pseudomonas sp. FW306-02-H06C]PMZ12559.1 vanillate O-demethylase oxidoreductase VanB [Pseudomonas sp. FW306-02-F02-AA]PMZ18439.1 vanillate O-demethylase oxidoreductase VanB [Pseudomonas sp. FW306-02-F08-AA]
MHSSDRIERKILLKAPRSTVWRALANAESFGKWFGVALEGKRFVAGERTQGQITYPGYEHLVWDVQVARVEPERVFAFRWHPYAVEPGMDYSSEPTTLVLFELEDMDGGTLLKVVESGFDNIPAERRLKAFRMNSRGWDEQMTNIETYLATP